MNIAFRIILVVMTLLIALVIGLILRRMLVHRLKRTVLDTWLIQSLGIMVIAGWLGHLLHRARGSSRRHRLLWESHEVNSGSPFREAVELGLS